MDANQQGGVISSTLLVYLSRTRMRTSASFISTFFWSYMQINYAIFTIFLLYCICRIRDDNLYHAIIDLK